jgi:hypothetical protein
MIVGGGTRSPGTPERHDRPGRFGSAVEERRAIAVNAALASPLRRSPTVACGSTVPERSGTPAACGWVVSLRLPVPVGCCGEASAGRRTAEVRIRSPTVPLRRVLALPSEPVRTTALESVAATGAGSNVGVGVAI